jgi:hypothetical protein
MLVKSELLELEGEFESKAETNSCVDIEQVHIS